MKYAEAQVRQLCASRGLNWDTMTEEEREDFIDNLVHEDREMQPIAVYDTNVLISGMVWGRGTL